MVTKKKLKSYSIGHRTRFGLVQLNCEIPRQLKEKLDRILDKRNVSTTNFITTQIENFIEAKKNEQ